MRERCGFPLRSLTPPSVSSVSPDYPGLLTVIQLIDKAREQGQDFMSNPVMTNTLTTYLQDHLAGSMHAIELLKAMRDHQASEPLGQFAGQLLIEIEADRNVLSDLVRRTGTTPGGVKEWGAWLAEKVSRLKLKHGSGDGLGTFEALEFLMLGIHGKWALWRALSEIARFDSRLKSTDFSQLTARAESQEAQVDERRLALAESAFGQG
jgi:hypothetical protein